MKKWNLLSWNVNGIRAVHNKGLLLPIFKDDLDVICLQETKASPDQLKKDIREIDGFHSYFDWAERKGYSGVALYCREEPLYIKRGLGIEKFDVEGRVLEADFKDFILLNIYFPNGGASPERLAYKMAFYDACLDHLEAIRKDGKNIVVCGDVNTAHKEIDLARPKENEKVSGFLPEERAWIDKLIDHGYIDTFRLFNHEGGQYSWWDMKTRARERNIGWRIDYFFVNDEFRQAVKNASILSDIQGSDHCPVTLQLEIN